MIDALVLVFSHSAIATIVGTDALRSVLAVEYHDMVKDGVFDMQQLWELLADQPGFDPAAAAPPLCLIRTWQDKLGLEMRLPEALAEMDDRDRALEANKCRVPTAEIKLLFRMTSAPRPAPARPDTPSASDSRRAARNRAATPPPVKRRPAWQGWLAGIVALATLGFTGATLYGHCNRSAGEWSPAQVKLNDLPTRSVTRMGSQVRAEVDAGEWSKLDADVKRQKLRAALRGVEDRGVKVIALRAGTSLLATVEKSRGGDVYVWLNGQP